MALRGETIGTAFVRILADGTGFAKSIEGEMDKGKEPMRKAGEEHSKAYKDSFNKEQKKNNKFIKDIQKNLDSAEGIFAARGHVAGEEFQKGISEGVQKILQGTEMEDRAKEIGDKVAQNLSIGLNSNGNLNKDFTANIINAIKDIQKEEAAALKKTRTDQKTAIKDLSNQLDELISRHKALGGAHKKNGDSSKDLVRDFRKLVGEIDNTSGAIDVTRKRVRSLSGDMKSSGTGLRRFFTEMDKDKTAAANTANTLTQAALARSAINAGVITGFGANQRIDMQRLQAWGLNNGLSGNLASNTEQMNAAIKSMLNIAVQNIQGGDTRVTDADIKLASGTIGADPTLQLETIKKLIANNERIAREKLNDFEDRRDYYLKGTRAERAYHVPTHQTADPRYIDALVKNKDSSADRDEFDRRFGAGAAALELARAKRRER